VPVGVRLARRFLTVVGVRRPLVERIHGTVSLSLSYPKLVVCPAWSVSLVLWASASYGLRSVGGAIPSADGKSFSCRDSGS
jgi:hypothetical protein